MHKMPNNTQSKGNDNNVFIFNHPDDDQVAKKLKKFLTEKGYDCFTLEEMEIGKNVLKGVDELQSRSRRLVCIISEVLLKDEELCFQLEQLQIESKEKKKVMIAVLHNIDASTVPFYIKETNYTQTTDEHFKDKILNGLESEFIPPSATIPITGIAEGLAWAYWYNYLSCILPGLKDRMKKQFEGTGVRYSPKFVLLMPTSCQARNLNHIDKNISMLKPLKFRITVGGAHDRDYSNNVVKITHPETKEEILAVVEFATPLETLHEMELGVRAGLSTEEKLKQMEEFFEKINEIINRFSDTALVTLKYDDRSDQARRDPHHLSKLILKRIQT